MKKCIVNGRVISGHDILETNIFIDDNHIIALSDRAPVDEDIIDAQHHYVAPGFIDVHTHGRAGSDTMYATFKDLNNMSCAAMKTGVTSFLATTMTMSIDDTYKAIANIHDHMGQVTGAQVLGAHMEGPFLNKIFKGAQPAEFMLEPTTDHLKKMVGDYQDIVKKISIAPELPGSYDFIKYCKAHQIVVSAGHTNASFQEAMTGIEAGITSATHTYNAMSPLKHRDPGVVGAAMLSDDVYAELILDGIHVSFPAAAILLRMKGKEKLILITDSMEAASLPDGKYALGGQDVYVKDKQARLIDGTLAGSVLSMNDAIRNAHEQLDLTLPEAVALATINPAKSLNLDDRGIIAAGKKADLVIFDEKIRIKKVIIDGKMKWEEE